MDNPRSRSTVSKRGAAAGVSPRTFCVMTLIETERTRLQRDDDPVYLTRYGPPLNGRMVVPSLEQKGPAKRRCVDLSLPDHEGTAGSRYSGVMATMFIQQSTEYIQQIEAEIERLQQLREQVQATIQSEEQLEVEEQPAPRKRAAKKSVGKKAAAKKRGRPKAEVPAA